MSISHIDRQDFFRRCRLKAPGISNFHAESPAITGIQAGKSNHRGYPPSFRGKLITHIGLKPKRARRSAPESAQPLRSLPAFPIGTAPCGCHSHLDSCPTWDIRLPPPDGRPFHIFL